MCTRHSNAVSGRPFALALCGALLVPALAPAAGTLTISNDTDRPVIVQAVAVVGKTIIRGRPYKLLKKSDSTPALKLPDTNTTVYIYDAGVGNRLLGTTVVPASADDLYYAVVADTPPPKLKLEGRKAPGAAMKP